MKTLLKILGLGTLGILVGSVYLTGLCSQNWCTPFSVSKISQAVDFATCRDLGFAVIASHPQRCHAGITMFLEDETAPVRLVQPGDGDAVGLPMHIAGEAALGTGETLQYRLEDQDGFVLDDHSIVVVRDASGAYVQFSADVLYPRPFGTGGTLVLSTVDATGREINAIAVPVRFIQADAVEVKIYFGNRERDPQAAACDVSYPVARRIPHSDDPVEAALRELLQGPSLSEGRQQFFTSIPDGVRVQDAAWADGVLTVDFSSALMEETGGSCRVTAIRAQIEQTLKQFPSVRSVVLTVDGKTEGVLEP